MIEVRFLPEPVTSNSQLWFFYELHVAHTNHPTSRLGRVEVLDGDTGSCLLTYDGLVLQRHSLERTHEGYTVVAEREDANPSVRLPAAVLIALAVGPRGVPRNLIHRVTFVSAEDRQTVEDGARVPVPTGRPVVVGPPLRGRNWVAINTPHNVDGHRKFFLEVDGREVAVQRFARSCASCWRIPSPQMSAGPSCLHPKHLCLPCGMVLCHYPPDLFRVSLVVQHLSIEGCRRLGRGGFETRPVVVGRRSNHW